MNVLDRVAGRLLEAVQPDDEVRAMARTKDLVSADGTIPRDRIRERHPWQARDFLIPGVVIIGASRGGIFSFPQGAMIRRLSARCRTAPTGSSAEFSLAVNGAGTGDALRISIPAGQTAADANAMYELPAGANVSLIAMASNGVADVTITIHYQPMEASNG